MSNQDELLRAVIANPADDIVRLVYADALEENGQTALAAFIRAQCERARLPEWDPRAISLEAQEDRLYDVETRWLDDLQLQLGFPTEELPGDFKFSRGFPDVFIADADEVV